MILPVSGLLLSVWQSPRSSKLLQTTLFYSFYGWVIFHCIYVPHLLYPFICRWTSRLPPCTDVENRPVDTAGEGEGGTNWESNIDIYKLLCVKYITRGKLLYSTGSPAWHSVMTWGSRVGDGRRGGRLKRDRMYIYQKPTQHCKAISFNYKKIKWMT